MKHLNDQLAQDFPGAKLEHQDMRDRAMTSELEKVLDDVAAQRAQPESLSAQLSKVEAINRGLRERISHEKMRLIQEHDRRWTATQHNYARRIADAVEKLERERENDLRRLSDEYHEATREIDRISSRLD